MKNGQVVSSSHEYKWPHVASSSSSLPPFVTSIPDFHSLSLSASLFFFEFEVFLLSHLKPMLQPHRWREKSKHFLYGIFQLGMGGSGGWISANKGRSEKNDRCWMRLTNMNGTEKEVAVEKEVATKCTVRHYGVQREHKHCKGALTFKLQPRFMFLLLVGFAFTLQLSQCTENHNMTWIHPVIYTYVGCITLTWHWLGCSGNGHFNQF